MVDAGAFHAGVGALLAEVQRIKSEGDYEAARALIEDYGVHFDPSLRDEVVARVDALRLPSYSAFVMPRLSPGAGPTAASSTSRCPIRATSRRRCWSTPRSLAPDARMNRS